MFKIGDSVYAVQNIGAEVDELQVGKVIDVLEEWLPFPYIVAFNTGHNMPCTAKEIALD